ncbi:hypothetical protein NC651_022574 [Populus alba x Populus x berolinensis]|nr:hypothetical protein NC651_022574 [Populus alba x Populus x berolinensis]
MRLQGKELLLSFPSHIALLCFHGKTNSPISIHRDTIFIAFFLTFSTALYKAEGQLVCISRKLPTQVDGLPFNEYAWLTTHKLSAMGDLSASWSIILAPTIQQDTNGIRGLTLDFVRTSRMTSVQPAINVLTEIQAFLESQPINHQKIYTNFPSRTMFTSHHQRGVTKVFDAAGLMK